MAPKSGYSGRHYDVLRGFRLPLGEAVLPHHIVRAQTPAPVASAAMFPALCPAVSGDTTRIVTTNRYSAGQYQSRDDGESHPAGNDHRRGRPEVAAAEHSSGDEAAHGQDQAEHYCNHRHPQQSAQQSEIPAPQQLTGQTIAPPVMALTDGAERQPMVTNPPAPRWRRRPVDCR